MAAANAAAVKVRQRKTGRKTGVLHNCHIYPAAGSTNCDISEESSNCTDTSNDTTDGDTTDSDKKGNESKKVDASSCANSSSVEDDFFDEHHRPPSPFHHSSGLDPLTNRQIDKVINLFRPKHTVLPSLDHTAISHSISTTTDQKRKSSVKVIQQLR